jgi:hypothetical protein
MSAPTVTVEVAWTSTFSTPEGSRAWTDVTQYVDVDQAAVVIGFGRTDERSTADANSLTLTLNNRDGRFTPEKTTGAYYPNVKLYRPVRVTTQYAGGTARTRCLTYARAWNPSWAGGSDAQAQALLSAASRMQRLGLADPLGSVIEEEVLLDAPLGYWTLGDPQGATSVSDSSPNGNSLRISRGTPTFGTATGLATDGLTAVTLGNAAMQTWSTFALGLDLTFECFINAPAGAPTSPAYLISGADGGMWIETTGALTASARGVAVTGPAINDGKTHHLAWVWNGSSQTLYVDGVSVATQGVTLGTTGTAPITLGQPVDVATGYTFTMAHAAVFDGPLSAARIAAHAAAGLTGFAGEAVATRLARYASWRGIPAAEIDAVNTTRSVAHFNPSGMALLDAMRVLEQTESGVLCDTPAGHLRLTGEAGRYTAAPAFTLDLAQQYVTTEFVPQYDDAQLLNDVTVTNVGDQSTGRSVNQASVNSYGRAADGRQTASTYSDAKVDDASWLVARFSEPATRLQSVTITMHSLDDLSSLRESILAADIGTLVTITNLPAQFAASSGTWFIEGWSETYGPGTHYLTLNLSPSGPYLSTFILDDPVRGLLDSAYTLGH